MEERTSPRSSFATALLPRITRNVNFPSFRGLPSDGIPDNDFHVDQLGKLFDFLQLGDGFEPMQGGEELVPAQENREVQLARFNGELAPF